MKPDAAEETGIGKNQCATGLSQDEVIMLCRTECGGFNAEFACHTKMDSDPVFAGELEQHLFPARVRTQELASGQMLHDCLRVASAEEAFAAMELNFNDLLAQTGIPLSAKEFDFGEFRHITSYLLRRNEEIPNPKQFQKPKGENSNHDFSQPFTCRFSELRRFKQILHKGNGKITASEASF